MVNWIRKHRAMSQVIGFVVSSCVFGFIGWNSGIVALIVLMVFFEVVFRTGRKQKREVGDK